MAGAVYRIEERKSLGFIYTDAKREVHALVGGL